MAYAVNDHGIWHNKALSSVSSAPKKIDLSKKAIVIGWHNVIYETLVAQDGIIFSITTYKIFYETIFKVF